MNWSFAAHHISNNLRADDKRILHTSELPESIRPTTALSLNHNCSHKHDFRFCTRKLIGAVRLIGDGFDFRLFGQRLRICRSELQFVHLTGRRGYWQSLEVCSGS